MDVRHHNTIGVVIHWCRV